MTEIPIGTPDKLPVYASSKEKTQRVREKKEDRRQKEGKQKTEGTHKERRKRIKGKKRLG